MTPLSSRQFFRRKRRKHPVLIKIIGFFEEYREYREEYREGREDVTNRDAIEMYEMDALSARQQLGSIDLSLIVKSSLSSMRRRRGRGRRRNLKLPVSLNYPCCLTRSTHPLRYSTSSEERIGRRNIVATMVSRVMPNFLRWRWPRPRETRRRASRRIASSLRARGACEFPLWHSPLILPHPLLVSQSTHVKQLQIISVMVEPNGMESAHENHIHLLPMRSLHFLSLFSLSIELASSFHPSLSSTNIYIYIYIYLAWTLFSDIIHYPRRKRQRRPIGSSASQVQVDKS